MKSTAIYGPPGTGKTSTLVSLANEHLTAGEQVLYLSFSKAAAIEATSRLKKQITPSTVHAYAYQFLDVQKSQVVDFKKLMEFARISGIPMKGYDDSDRIEEGDLYLQVLGYAINTKRNLDEAYDKFGRPGTPTKFGMFCNGYADWKSEYGYVDFNDMLLQFIGSGDTPKCPPVVMLDEAQDCSLLLWDCFHKIIIHAKHVYLAGDDDQAIYEWNGAEPHGIEQFGAQSRTILDRSYRVPNRVHWMVHDRLLQRFDRRVHKPFQPAAREGGVIRYGSYTLFPFEDFRGEDLKILVRDKFQLLEIQRTLNASLIPYHCPGGFSPWTGRLARLMRQGKSIHDLDLNANQMEFYSHADLTEPVTIELSTIHQAKGKEAKYVALDCTMNGTTIENLELNPDAERRVWYVGCTRASEELYLLGENPVC